MHTILMVLYAVDNSQLTLVGLAASRWVGRLADKLWVDFEFLKFSTG